MQILDGKIDYAEYKEIQASRANRKWGNRHSARDRISLRFQELFDQAGDIIGGSKVIGCMGIRNGMEYFEFKKRLKSAEVYGVDLGDRVKEVGRNCFQYDFNQLPEDWENKFDLVFSNSLDHSFVVEETLKEWRRVIKPNGYLLLDLSTAAPNWADRYAFSESDISSLLADFEIVKEPFMNSGDSFMVLAKC